MINRPFSDLPAWVRHFSQVEIPVLRRTVQQMELLRQHEDEVNARTLAGVVQQDPLMALKVFNYLEANRRRSQTTDITTLDRAIMMLGVTPFFRIFQRPPIVEEALKAHPKALVGLLKTISRIHRAVDFARDWAVLRHDLEVGDIVVATLLHDSAELLMWSFAPGLSLQVKEMQALDSDLRSSVAQERVFGIQLIDLQQELARTWNLPRLLIALMDDKQIEHARVRNVACAINLARHSAQGWNNPALLEDYRDIAQLLHVSERTVMIRLGQAEEAPEDEDAEVMTALPSDETALPVAMQAQPGSINLD